MRLAELKKRIDGRHEIRSYGHFTNEEIVAMSRERWLLVWREKPIKQIGKGGLNEVQALQ